MVVSCQLHDPAASPRQRTLGTYWIGSYVGPRAGLDAIAKTKVLYLLLPVIESHSVSHDMICEYCDSYHVRWVPCHHGMARP